MTKNNQDRNHVRKAIMYAENYCKKNGLRFTDLRRQVFEIIWQSKSAVTAADLMKQVGSGQPPLTYRALDFLKEQGLIRHIVSINAYVGSISPDRISKSQFLICNKCFHFEEIKAEAIYKKLVSNSENDNFLVDQTFIEVLGTCASCQN